MVLGASNYTYAEATYTQSAIDFVEATINGFEYFGCVREGCRHWYAMPSVSAKSASMQRAREHS